MSAAESRSEAMLHNFKDTDNRHKDYPDDQSAIYELTRVIIRLSELGWQNPDAVGLLEGGYEAISAGSHEISTCCRYVRDGEVVYRTIRDGAMHFGRPFMVRAI